MWRIEKDELGAEVLLKHKEFDECWLMEYSNLLNKAWHPKVKHRSNDVDGMACTNNRTLSFVALDSLMHYQLAEGLGIDVLNAYKKTVAVIVDIKVSMNHSTSVSYIQNWIQFFCARPQFTAFYVQNCREPIMTSPYSEPLEIFGLKHNVSLASRQYCGSWLQKVDKSRRHQKRKVWCLQLQTSFTANWDIAQKKGFDYHNLVFMPNLIL